jgi:hypothetical protein
MFDPIVAFYSGEPDTQGRTLGTMLSGSDDWLESTHDYIQWMFPTRERSAVNPRAPIVRRDTEHAFTEREELRQALSLSLERMLGFYGLKRIDGKIEQDDTRFPQRAAVWLRPGNHNHLRLTRIMKSLAILGLPDLARSLQHCLVDIYEGPGHSRITRETAEYWLSALDR